MDGACSMHGRDETTYTIFVTKPLGKRLLWRLVGKGEDNIKIK